MLPGLCDDGFTVNDTGTKRKGITMATWTKTAIVALIDGSNGIDAMKRAILFLYSVQTRDERVQRDTKWDNDQGFSKRTVTRGTRIADRLLNAMRANNAALADKIARDGQDALTDAESAEFKAILAAIPLTAEDMHDARNVCLIHAGQLAERANATAARNAARRAYDAGEAKLAPYAAEFERWMALPACA